MNGFEIAVSVCITLFSGAWIVFGVGWIKKVSKRLSGTPIRVKTLD